MAATLALSAAVLATGSWAQDGPEPLTLENEQALSEVTRDPAGYWTPAEMQSAVRVDLLIPDYASNIETMDQLETALEEEFGREEQTEAPEQQPSFVDGAAPLEEPVPDLQDMLFPPAATTEELIEAQSALEVFDEGTLHAPFTSSRVAFGNLRLQYPYRATGKLFFRTPRGPSWCSAAVLRPRIILTAGHCVHRGSGGGNGWYSNWLFVPAYHNGQAPYQAWNWRWAITTGTWANGGGGVPNAADFAIIELEDRRVGNQIRKIGSWLGYFGYHTNILQRNHVKMIGYPGNLDRGNIMHQVDAGDFRGGGKNTVLYGSDARGGSSGGPWVMNFGSPAQGQVGGLRPWRNRIVGVTSYGYIATGPKVQGSSILNREFLNILNTACSHRAGNC